MNTFKNLLFTILTIPFIVFSSLKVEASNGKLYVAKSGKDTNKGSKKSPFLTIQKAADVAEPGDVITVKEGTYRESITLSKGGSKDKPIVFQAAEGDEVFILGSEPAKDWKQTDDGSWKVTLDSTFFGAFNPFATLTRHPEHVAIDEAGDGWGWLKYGRWTHLGDIILDGEGLSEKQYKREVSENKLSWYAEVQNGKTTIWANFGEKDPNQSQVEINKRPFAFHTATAGLAFITIKGFTIMNMASHWAPPTVYQPGAIWANGGHHWVIEDNIILYVKGAAISLGIPNGKANMANSGHHTIKNNVIMRCGQGAIAGQMWNSNTEITGNHIEDINYRKEYGGWETAAIKHHNSDNLLVKNNFIRGIYTMDPDTGAAHGIWSDFNNSNWQVSENIIMNTDAHAIVTEANWKGPNLYANNIIYNGSVASYSSRGDAWVHNLLVDAEHVLESQSWGERTSVGDFRWVNNVFVGKGLNTEVTVDKDIYSDNVYLDDATIHPKDTNPVSCEEPSQIKFIEKTDGVAMNIYMPEEVLTASNSVVNNELLELQFKPEIAVESDFLGNARSQTVTAGPFNNLNASLNQITIYEYPELYKRAVKYIGK